MQLRLKESSPSFFQKVLEAPSLLLKNRRSRSALTSIWGAIICTSIFNIALVFYVTSTLQASGTVYAIIAQAFIVGRIFGARFSAHLSAHNAEKALTGAGFAMGCFIALPGLIPSLWLCIPCFFLSGVCNAVQVAALRIIVVGTVPDEVKPKALSTMGSINSSAMLIGYIIGAPVVSAIGTCRIRNWNLRAYSGTSPETPFATMTMRAPSCCFSVSSRAAYPCSLRRQ